MRREPRRIHWSTTVEGLSTVEVVFDALVQPLPGGHWSVDDLGACYYDGDRLHALGPDSLLRDLGMTEEQLHAELCERYVEAEEDEEERWGSIQHEGLTWTGWRSCDA